MSRFCSHQAPEVCRVCADPSDWWSLPASKTDARKLPLLLAGVDLGAVCHDVPVTRVRDVICDLCRWYARWQVGADRTPACPEHTVDVVGRVWQGMQAKERAA